MDEKALIVWELKKEERVYQLQMPWGAPFGEVYDVIFHFLNQVTEKAKQEAEKVKPTEKDETPATAVDAYLVDNNQVNS